MGGVGWRLSYGLINLLYLVGYNNYSLQHIEGVDIGMLGMPLDILVTDTYANI